MKAADLRQKTHAELQQELLDLRREQFNLRMQLGSENLRMHEFKRLRRQIARVLTLLTEKNKAQETSK